MAPQKQVVAGPSKKARVEAKSSSRAQSRSKILTKLHHPPQRGNPNFCLKTFLQPRWLDFADLVIALPTLQFMFTSLGWDTFISNHRVYYPELVYEFYENLYVEDEKMFSIVKGRKIRVSDKVFGGALNISYRDQTVELI